MYQSNIYEFYKDKNRQEHLFRLMSRYLKVIKPEENFKWLLKINNMYFPLKSKNNKERKVIF